MKKPAKRTPENIQRLLVVLPNWVGDVVMATPTLRALRQLYPDASITYLLKSYVRPLLSGSPWHDRLLVIRPRTKRSSAAPRTPRQRPRPSLGARIKRRKFDAVVLLTNSFRSALPGVLAGIRHRVGYDRDGRGLLLTDRLVPLRHEGRYVPVPLIDYYLGIARYLGSDSPDTHMQLFTRPADDARAEHLLLKAAGPVGSAPLVMLNPGAANLGDAKLWPADRYAALADALVEKLGAVILVNGSPRDRAVVNAVLKGAKHPLVDLAHAAERSRIDGLLLLKSVLRRCDLLISNDTGARHVAAAVGTPVISLFGPTDPHWTQLGFDGEVVIQAPPGPVKNVKHKRFAPRAMTGITVDQVLAEAQRVLKSVAR